MIGYPECRHDGRRKKCGCTKAGTQRFKCLECGKKFTDSTRTLGGMRIRRRGESDRSVVEAFLSRGTAFPPARPGVLEFALDPRALFAEEHAPPFRHIPCA